MDERLTDQVERTLTEAAPAAAPAELRVAVLKAVHRELGRSQRDRWAMRSAVILLALGAGMNILLAMKTTSPMHHTAGSSISNDALVEAAVIVAEATDAETARKFARHMVMMGGRSPSEELLAAIDSAIDHRLARAGT